jgi:NitT/TauT family transport system ATP-binding protein
MSALDSINVQNLSVRFGNLQVLNQFNLKIPVGSKVGLMGSSGSGKTTLLHALMGLVKPVEGKISGIDQNIISVVFQENRLCEQLNVIRNVLLPLDDTPENRAKAQSLLESVGLSSDIWDRRVRELSGGMKRRVAIVRALLFPASVYLMDEPLKELDETNRDIAARCIRECTAGKTVIFSTHDPDDIKRLHADLLINLDS